MPRGLRVLLPLAAATLYLVARAAGAAQCSGVVYLTLDTGNMSHAEEIAAILRRHDVRATFFLANEKTPRGDSALDPSWAGYWKARAAEGHAFGTHTWRHGRISEATSGVAYRPQFGDDAGRTLMLDDAQFCSELRRVDTMFREYTGQSLDAVWRAPGGHVTARARGSAQACGYAHVRWADAGFLGDELPSGKYPNRMLVERALRDIRGGDVLMAHLGIWSRKDPFAPMLDPLIAGLKQRGLCFRTLREHPDYRRDAPPDVLASATPRTASR
jgi:peptidoglycan/xylan/chitin deacetylase (PgdA/CDA1 family)